MSIKLKIINRVLNLFNQTPVSALDETDSAISKYLAKLDTHHYQYQSMSNMYTNLKLLEVQKDEDSGKFLVPPDIIQCLTDGFVIQNGELRELDVIPHETRYRANSIFYPNAQFWNVLKYSNMTNRLTVLVRRLTPIDETTPNYQELLATSIAYEDYALTRDLSKLDVLKQLHEKALKRLFDEEINFANLNLADLRRRGK
jgi:hypothetical protein